MIRELVHLEEEKVDYQSCRGGVRGQEEIGRQDGMVKNERVQVGESAF